jgi:hypothetical protein
VRRFVALTLALTLLSSGVTGCSQPIDTGSTVPAQTQPIVALLALVGLGIGLTAWHHHNEHRVGAGGSGPTIFPAQISVPPFIGGYTPVDLVADASTFTIGALELPTGGGGTGKFTEFFSNSAPFGTYTLPVSYAPAAVAMDSSGVTWFVNAAGRVQGCGQMTSSSTSCTSVGIFSDGLGSGSRSIAADINLIVVVTDAGAGKVKWWAQQGTVATGTGTYSPSTTSPIFANDAIELTTTSPSGFTVYHQDGTSDFITFGVSGSTLTINNQPNFTFNPAPLTGLSNVQSGAKSDFYSFTGQPSAAYSLTKYETPSAVGLVNPTVTSQLIEFNGQEDPNGAPFTSPLVSPHYDAAEAFLWAIDKNGNVIGFSPF